jgi:phosphatidate cytidylyltransferase
MALNFKTLGVRTVSALIFVAALLGCLLWNYYSFTLFFLVVAMWGLYEFYTLAEKLNAQPYKTAGYMGAFITYFSFINTRIMFGIETHPWILLAIVPVIIFLPAIFIQRNNPIHNALFTVGGIVYCVLPLGLLHQLVINKTLEGEPYFFPFLLFGIILLIWGNDTFAYLCGSIFGKHKMIERISPGKTWEGTILGVLLTFGGSFLIAQGNVVLWMILGVIVPVTATIGDLVESLLKRQAGVKDTGNIMPGHGGILDRFDSLIFVSPVAFVIVKLWFKA